MTKRNRRRYLIIISAAVIILAAALFVWAGKASADSLEEQTEAIKEAISSRALQCYVIEGAYPENLDYLIDNYGLAVNREDYKIIYTSYAENMPPEVRVLSLRDRK